MFLDRAGFGLHEKKDQPKNNEVESEQAVDVIVYRTQVDQSQDAYEEKERNG